MQRSTLSSAEQVAESTDTLSEILLRLPPRSLLRFKCVSKQWFSLISDHQFCLTHTTTTLLHRTLPSIFLSHTPESSSSPCFLVIPLTPANKIRVLNLDFLNRRHVSVVHSSNGLLLCHAGPTTYFVCNPTTKRFVALAFPNEKLARNQTRAVYLAFEPRRSPHFRVVSIRMTTMNGHDSISCDCEVYCSETSSWSHPPANFTAPRHLVYTPGVYCNDAVHWCSDGVSSVHYDVGKGRLKNLSIPVHDEEWGMRNVEYFRESGDRLYLILAKRTLKFDVFELKEECSLWLLKHKVDLNPARYEFPQLRWDLASFVMPLYIACQEKQGSSVLVFVVAGTAIYYDPVCCTWRKLCDFKPHMTSLDAVAGYLSGEVFQYYESLSLV